MTEKKSTDAELIACLLRSGYCMEGRLAKALGGKGYFVETNQSLLDKESGKSREIDLVAEHFDFESTTEKIYVTTTLVIEAVNNPSPIAFLTPWSWTPWSAQEGFIPHACTPLEETENHPFFVHENHADMMAIPDSTIFTQYCGFSRKKSGGELMASHPDDLHTSLTKAVDYALDRRQSALEWMKNASDDYWRISNWQPVIVLQGELMLVRDKSDGLELESVQAAHLLYNFHHRGIPTSVAVAFVTEKGFPDWAAAIVARDAALEQKLFKQREEPGQKRSG